MEMDKIQAGAYWTEVSMTPRHRASLEPGLGWHKGSLSAAMQAKDCDDI